MANAILMDHEGEYDEMVAATAAIAHEIGERWKPEQVGLAGGLSGLVLLNLAVLSCRPSDRIALRRTENSISQLRNMASSRPTLPSLFVGAAGVAWVLLRAGQVLRDGTLIGASRYLVDQLAWILSQPLVDDVGNDLITGLAGIGVLAEAAAEHDGDLRLMNVVTSVLRERAEVTATGLVWRSQPSHLAPTARLRYPTGCHDYGVAHGHAGLTTLLIRAAALTGAACDAKLAQGALTWLSSEVDFSRFPSLPTIVVTEESRSSTLPTWCYGDAGTAAVMKECAPTSIGSGARRLGGRIAKHWADRMKTFDPASRLQGHGLCHGTAGAWALLLSSAPELGTDAFSRSKLMSATWERVRSAAAGGDASATSNAAANSGSEQAVGLMNGLCGQALATLTSVNPGVARLWKPLFLL